MKKYLYPVLTALGACALLFAGPWAFKSYSAPFPPANLIKEVRAGAAEDALALTLGLRRLAADVWFVRLMQYYGTSELEMEFDSAEGARGHKAGPHYHGGVRCEGVHFGEGRYPEFLGYARHILALDPYFLNAGLYAAASLAFNLSRPEEAVSLVNWALIYAPKEWKYVRLLAAIGYSKAKNPAKVAQLIAPLLEEPDCPVMIRQLAAFLNKKAGNHAAAYAIYRSILGSTRDRLYIENAKKEMAKMEQKSKVESK
ncbi:MAG: hypothetical protein HY796_11375 [Elusimicrobia bacterium]|nr:hypothetical protein [Elusimicrobiota bacterium]